jgi:hypothetical protein
MKHLTILLLLVLAACTSNNKEGKPVITPADTTATKPVAQTKHLSAEDSLQAVFDSLRDGRGCSYSTNKKDGKFFFIHVQDDTNGAYILLNHKIIQLKKYIKKWEGEHAVETFISDTYTVTIRNKKEVIENEEERSEEAIMTIKSSDGKTISKNIHGECGD